MNESREFTPQEELPKEYTGDIIDLSTFDADKAAKEELIKLNSQKSLLESKIKMSQDDETKLAEVRSQISFYKGMRDKGARGDESKIANA